MNTRTIGRRGFSWRIAIVTVGLAILAPAVGRTDPTPYQCSYYTCVTTNISNVVITCFTNAEHRPQCSATATASATGKLYHGGFDTRYHVTYQVETHGGTAYRLAPGSVPAKPALYKNAGYWGGDGPKTISGIVKAAAVMGPVNGCLLYRATFTIFAYAGNVVFTAGGQTNMVDSIAIPHTHTVGKSYCS